MPHREKNGSFGGRFPLKVLLGKGFRFIEPRDTALPCPYRVS